LSGRRHRPAAARRLRRIGGALAAAGVLAGGCSAPAVPPPGAGAGPFTRHDRALWEQAAQEAARLQARARIHDDPELAAYLKSVARRLLPDDARAAGGPPLSVAVLRDPALAAFALPHGRLYVHTGLLSRLDGEAQLAAVLARQIAHVTHRHALRMAHAPGPGLPRFAPLPVEGGTGGPLPPPGGGIALGSPSSTAAAILGQELQLAAVAAIAGYPPDLEREADAEGLDRLARAGYDPREMPGAFERLEGDLGARGPLEVFAVGRADWVRARAASARDLLAVRYPAVAVTGGVRTTDEFRRRMTSVVRDNAALDLRAGRFDLARDQLERARARWPRPRATRSRTCTRVTSPGCAASGSTAPPSGPSSPGGRGATTSARSRWTRPCPTPTGSSACSTTSRATR
jgi:hypothetical protein